MTFGEKLQQLRKQNGYSQEQLAAQLTVSRQAISKWELDHALPDTENVIQLCRIFQVSADYLLLDERETPAAAPAAPKDMKEPDTKRIPFYRCLFGILAAAFGFIGMLTIGILSSIYPAFITYPMEVGREGASYVKTGLPAFLELHNIEWLFLLCGFIGLGGILLLILPVVFKKIRNRRGLDCRPDKR